MERQAKTSLPVVAGSMPAKFRQTELPEIVARSGDAARFAWDEFFRVEIRNPIASRLRNQRRDSKL